MSETPQVFNGIDAASGEYLTPPLTAAQVAQLALAAYALDRSDDAGAAEQERLRLVMNKKVTAVRHPERLSSDPADVALRDEIGLSNFALASFLDPKDLAQAGWGVILPQGADPALLEPLRPLLNLRKQQAGALYQEFTGDRGFRAGDVSTKWLARNKGSVSGPVDPTKGVPYYLLIVGGPEQIPFEFQYQLDIQYAVGRLCFAGPEAAASYQRYALSVVAAETSGQALPRQAAFFGTRNPGDGATALSADNLVAPLSDKVQQLTARDGRDWQVSTLAAEQATKQRLGALLGGAETPALLFTASHGMGFPSGAAAQSHDQGALLCQDWPGPIAHKGPIPPSFYFGAADIPADARLFGLIAFFFACYGAGTPQQDDYPQETGARKQIAPAPFVAALPQALLSHPQGGALAVIGHVDRAWGTSFMAERAGRQTTVFENVLYDLLDGLPVGAALDAMNERYAELGSYLAHDLYSVVVEQRAEYDHLLMADRWTACNDARGFVVLGDPAVRLMTSGVPVTERPVVMTSGTQPQAAVADPLPLLRAALRATLDALPPLVDAQADALKLTRAQDLAEEIGRILG